MGVCSARWYTLARSSHTAVIGNSWFGPPARVIISQKLYLIPRVITSIDPSDIWVFFIPLRDLMLLWRRPHVYFFEAVEKIDFGVPLYQLEVLSRPFVYMEASRIQRGAKYRGAAEWQQELKPLNMLKRSGRDLKWSCICCSLHRAT